MSGNFTQLIEVSRRRRRLTEHDHSRGIGALDPRGAIEVDAPNTCVPPRGTHPSQRR
jgi:hypothetical protein